MRWCNNSNLSNCLDFDVAAFTATCVWVDLNAIWWKAKHATVHTKLSIGWLFWQLGIHPIEFSLTHILSYVISLLRRQKICIDVNSLLRADQLWITRGCILVIRESLKETRTFLQQQFETSVCNKPKKGDKPKKKVCRDELQQLPARWIFVSIDPDRDFSSMLRSCR